jgi:ligand-binding SRPBCC domain-containing protein
MRNKVYKKQTVMPGNLEQIIAFHSAPGIFQTLTPPPIFIQVLRNDLISLTEGEIVFRLWAGPIPLYWLARHEPGPIPSSFIDRMLQGPMNYWEHQHIFKAVPGGVELTDQITFQHKKGLIGVFTRLFFDGLPLRILFAYRHWITRRALARLSP